MRNLSVAHDTPSSTDKELESVLMYRSTGNQDDSLIVRKYRDNGKVSYELLADGEFNEDELEEFIDNLIAMRDGAQVKASERQPIA